MFLTTSDPWLITSVSSISIEHRAVHLFIPPILAKATSAAAVDAAVGAIVDLLANAKVDIAGLVNVDIAADVDAIVGVNVNLIVVSRFHPAFVMNYSSSSTPRNSSRRSP